MSSTIEGHRVDPDNGLFDGTQYDLPIPQQDGHKADVLRVAVGGQIDLDLYDQQALDFLNSLKLGQELELTLTVRVSGTGWRHGLKGEDAEDHVVHQVALKAHTLTLPEA